jgi:sugar phosphate isomerase/epimerase
MIKPQIALQLYSLRDETKVDFAGTAEEVARIGYTGVELAGYGNLDVHAANRVLREVGLAVAGTHILREALRENFEKVVEEALILGTSEVICPWWPAEEFVSVNAAEKIGQELESYGARLRERGLLFSFHHHKAEFRLLEGRPILSWMLGAAAPRFLGVEVDVYWAHLAGYAPPRFLYEQGERVRLLHLKDEKILGDGPVDFPAIFSAVETIGSVEWYIVEQENFDDAPLASVRQCLDRLRVWGK